ncbi:MbtH family protein [Methylocella sp.]|uniref:MbtH family protein n=1 Tax=Methylocella sp. TaxID=1978226 RepID=UPI0037847EB1
MSFDRDDIAFNVVINEEEQYSIWPAYKPVPLGWRKTGFSGDKAACLAHIDVVWTDMRPKSLRDAMAADAAS